jgi:hypothetical protein
LTSRFGLALAAVCILAACGGDDGEPPPTALSKEAASDGQSGPAGFRLAGPLIVDVKTADGSVATRGAVRWTVTTGTGATTSDSVTYANGAGQAQAYVTLGATVGGYTVRAALVLDDSKFVDFAITALAPPALASVTPATFTGGDTIVVAGTALDTDKVSAIEVAGMPARTIAQTPTSRTAVVPICLVPGAVTLHARVGNAVSNDLSATFTQTGATVRLNPGDYASVDPALLAGCATFPPAGAAGAEYLLAPQAVDGTPGNQTDYRLAGDSTTGAVPAPPPPHAGTPPTFADRFHDFLRGQEAQMARLPKPPVVAAAPGVAAASAAIAVGDRRTFHVCGKIGCQTLADFPQITAEAKYVGAHTAVFIDVAAPAGGFTQADFDDLGATFEDNLYDVDTRAFGAESDIDHNGVVIILLTPTVNALTSRDECSTSIVTGFFFGIDIDPTFAKDDRSNHGEVFYSVAPDSAGVASCALSSSVVKRLVPTTFVHEFQHMISYGQHVVLRNGEQEVLWLNEAMSHFAEELGGRRFKDLGQDQTFSNFVIGDLFNGYLFLKTPGSFFLFPSEGTATLEERGGGWLFVRWLTDKFGPDLTRRLEETNLTGEANIVAATGEPLTTLLPQWFLANYVSDLPAFSPPPRLVYDSWKFRTTYASLNQQLASRFDRPFPLVPQVFTIGTFAPTGTLHAGSGDFYRVVQAANQRGFTVNLTGPSGAAIDTSVLPRLNVIRIK